MESLNLIYTKSIIIGAALTSPSLPWPRMNKLIAVIPSDPSSFTYQPYPSRCSSIVARQLSSAAQVAEISNIKRKEMWASLSDQRQGQEENVDRG
jgi:hypothetical protein